MRAVPSPLPRIGQRALCGKFCSTARVQFPSDFCRASRIIPRKSVTLSRGKRTECAKHLARFRRLFAASTVAPAPTNLTTNLTAAEIRGVHVRVGETVAHDFQGGVEITYGNALADRPGDICRRNRSGDSS